MNRLIFEYRLFNRYTLITVVSLFLVLALSWFFVSNLGEILFMDYGAYDLPPVSPAENRAAMLPIFLQQIMNWEILINSSMAHIIHFMPLFFIFPTMTFAMEKKSYFIFGRHRFKSFSKSMFCAILQHSLIAALVSISTLILFHAIVGLFVTSTLDYITCFGSFLPDGFYANHPFSMQLCTVAQKVEFMIYFLT